MTLHPPFGKSTLRRLPFVRVADAYIYLEQISVISLSADNRCNRFRYYFYINVPGLTADGRPHYLYRCNLSDDLKSGVGGGAQAVFAALLRLLCAAGENTELFMPGLVEWAGQHSDELACLASEIEDTKNLIEP